MTHPIKVSYKFNEVPIPVQEEIKDLVQKNLEGKLDSYIKKILGKKEDAECRIEYIITYHEESKKFDASFVFSYDGESFVYKKEGFKYEVDLVNHAFQHFKESLSKK